MPIQPLPSGKAVRVCNSLSVQCPVAAVFWEQQANQHLSKHDIKLHSNKLHVGRDLMAAGGSKGCMRLSRLSEDVKGGDPISSLFEEVQNLLLGTANLPMLTGPLTVASAAKFST